MPLQPGTLLNNRYTIQGWIGQGGFGKVYRAYDKNLQRLCAVKENLETSPEAQAQFWREAQMLLDLRHENLPQVYDYFTDQDGKQYLVMEYVDGKKLEEIVNSVGVLDEKQAVAWVTQILDALEYLHTRQPPIIHRDIKPANILLTLQGKAMLVDFGIAKPYVAGQQTTRGAQAATLGYSPPEQYGEASTDARSDIYALGATLYFLLTGIEPPGSIQRAMSNVPLVAMRSRNPAISDHIEQVILKAMEVLPLNRIQSAKGMRQALNPPVYTTPLTAPIPPPHPPEDTTPLTPPIPVPTDERSKDSLRNWIVAGATVILVAVTTVGLVALFKLNSILPGFGLTPAETAARAAAMAGVTVSPTISSPSAQLPVPARTESPTAPPTATPTRVSPTPTATSTITPSPTATRIPVTPTPTIPLSAACSNPQAQITNPRMEVTVRQGTVLQVIGTANIPGFTFYRVHFQPDGGTNWGILASGTQPVMNGELMVWKTHTVDPGTYWLRLTVEDPTGNYPDPCIVKVVIQ